MKDGSDVKTQKACNQKSGGERFSYKVLTLLQSV